MNDNWTNSLRKKMSGFEIQEPDALLDSVFASLDSLQTAPAAGAEAKRRERLWAIPVAAVAAAAAVAAVVLLWPASEAVGPDRVAVGPEMVVGTDREAVAVGPDMAEADGAEAVVVPDGAAEGIVPEKAEAGETVAVVPKKAEAGAATAVVPKGAEYVAGEEGVAAAVPDGTVATASEETVEPNRAEAVIVPDGTGLLADVPWAEDGSGSLEETAKRRGGRMRLGIAYANQRAASSSFASPAALMPAVFGEDPRKEGPHGEIITRASSRGSDSEIRHRQPVRAGLSLRYSLSKRWGIETGVTYSYLVSDLVHRSDYASFSATQHLHYIGIPLQITFDFLQTRLLSLYAAGGGMVEKCVGGKTVTDYLSMGHFLFSSEEETMVKPLQWSVGTGLGAELHFTRNFGLYVEPGISYCFDNRGGVSTIYSDRPFNFSLKLGLRFSLGN